MDKDTLNDMVNGLTPDLIPFKVGEYRDEFDALKIQYAEEKGIDTENEGEMAAIDESAFRSFVMHKLATMDAVLLHIVSFLSEEDEEDGDED
jgi:hypothetical protein